MRELSGRFYLVLSLCILHVSQISSAPTDTDTSKQLSTAQDGVSLAKGSTCNFPPRDLFQIPYQHLCSNFSIPYRENDLSKKVSDTNQILCKVIMFATSKLCTDTTAVLPIQIFEKSSLPIKALIETNLEKTVETFCREFEKSVQVRNEDSTNEINTFFHSFFQKEKVDGGSNICLESCKDSNEAVRINVLCTLANVGFEMIQLLSVTTHNLQANSGIDHINKDSVLTNEGQDQLNSKPSIARTTSKSSGDLVRIAPHDSPNPNLAVGIGPSTSETSLIGYKSSNSVSSGSPSTPGQEILNIQNQMNALNENTSSSSNIENPIPEVSNPSKTQNSGDITPIDHPNPSSSVFQSSKIDKDDKQIKQDNGESAKPPEEQREEGKTLDPEDKGLPEDLADDSGESDSPGDIKSTDLAGNIPVIDSHAGKENQKSVFDDGDKVLHSSSIRNSLLKSLDDEQKEIFVNIDSDEENSGYFGYFITFIGLSCFCFIMFHNKKRLVALVVEGRRPRGTRRRSTSAAAYRKLDNNFDE